MKRTNTAAWLEKYNRWQIKVQKDGERRTFTSSIPGRNGQREANRKADDWLSGDVETRQRCEAALDMFTENIKERTSFSNYDVEERRVRLYIKPVLKNIYIDKLNNAILQSVIDKQAKHLSRKSLYNLRATLVAFVKFCRRNKWTGYIPDDLTVPKGSFVEEKKILQPEDLKILFNSDYTTWRGKKTFEPYVNAWRFQVLTGLRPGELFGLMWSDISNGYVSLRRSINRDGDITRGKNDNAIRSFKLTPYASAILASQPKTSVYVFPVNSGTHYKDCLARYCKANGITVVTPYELRHTFISVAKRLPEGLVKSIVGHSQDMDTFGVYGHTLAGDEEIAAKELQDIFSKLFEVG